VGLTLPDRPAQHFIDAVLLPNWDPATAQGYDVHAPPESEAFLPVATSIDNVGAVYPSLIIRYSNETSGGETTYDFMTDAGPGQTRTGELIATVRAQDRSGGYAGSDAHEPLDADDLVVALAEAVEALVARTATGGTSAFQTLGSQRGPDIPPDLEEDPPVRLADAQISYSWVRQP